MKSAKGKSKQIQTQTQSQKQKSEKQLTSETSTLNLLYSSNRIITFDTETTGLNPNYDHILSIAAIEIVNGKFTGKQFHGFISPRKKIESSAINIHKMDNSFYNTYYSNIYKSDKELILNFLDFIGNDYLVAFNAMFDYNFLINEIKYWGIEKSVLKEKVICLMRLFKEVYCRSKNDKLSSVCQFLGIKANDEYHNALFDSIMCGKVLCKIFDEKIIRNTEITQKIDIPNRINNSKQNSNRNSQDNSQNKKDISIDIKEKEDFQIIDNQNTNLNKIKIDCFVNIDKNDNVMNGNEKDDLCHYKSIMEDYINHINKVNLEKKSFFETSNVSLCEDELMIILND